MSGERKCRIIQLFHQADRTIKRSTNKKLEKTGVYRSQHQLLMMLGKHPESSQTELAEKLEISPAAVAVSLKKLEKAGYIIRQSTESDNRVNHVTITEKGRAAIDRSVVCFKELEGAFFEGFDEEELIFLENFLKRMIKNGEDYYQKMKQEDRL